MTAISPQQRLQILPESKTACCGGGIAASALHVSERFAGAAEQAEPVRRYLHEILAGRTDVDDAALLASELFSNAIRHTLSGRPGGSVRVDVTVTEDRVRVEVRDAGPLDGRAPTLRDWFDETGRGLRIVDACALAWGWSPPAVDAGRGTVVWFELPALTGDR